jgi:hypothetical protein
MSMITTHFSENDLVELVATPNSPANLFCDLGKVVTNPVELKSTIMPPQPLVPRSTLPCYAGKIEHYGI